MPCPRLLLFDIDGTLILTDRAGVVAFGEALQETFGHEDDLAHVDFAGATDTGIVAQLFKHHGITEGDEPRQRFHAAYVARLAHQLPRRRGRVLPGVRELLDALRARADEALPALLTGNFAEGARLKLSHFGLAEYFAFGAYADDSPDRNLLGPVALERARRHRPEGRWDDPARDLVIIGDTPKDIACARAAGASVLAVATGKFSERELCDHGADHVLPDLADTGRVLEILLPPGRG